MTSADSRPLWTQRFYRVFFAVLAIRVLFAAMFPLGFAGDEAYYWDWGRRLDWGYYSKPPMVAWLMALASWIGGNSYFVIKLLPVVLTAGGTLALFHLARAMYGAQAGFWAAAVVMATPASAALSILLTIDPPLFCFWSLSLWLAWRWLNGAEDWRTSLALAVALGCGHLSKPIQLLFLPMLLLFLALSPQDRPRLLHLKTYAVLLGSLLFLLPVVYWNVKHDWITFAHTAHHFESPDFRLAKLISRPLEFIGAQLGLCSPVVLFLAMACLIAVAFRWRQLQRREWFLFCLSAPMLLGVYLMSFWQRVHPNWPLVFYISALVLLGGWAVTDLDLGRRLRTWRKAFRPGLWLAISLSCLAYFATFAIGWTPWAGTKADPTERLRGWEALGQQVGQVLTNLPNPDRTLVIVPSRRQMASQLAYYLPSQPTVYRLEDPARVNSQYGIWGGPVGKEGWDGLIVMEGQGITGPPAELVEAFDQVTPAGEVRIRMGLGEHYRTATLFYGQNFRGWPYRTVAANTE